LTTIKFPLNQYATSELAAHVLKFLSILNAGDWILLLSIMMFLLWIARFGMWPYCLVTFPGTLSHELVHFLLALIFFASPSFPNMIPRRNGDSWTMGSVNFIPTIFNSIPVALAPLLLFPLGLIFAVYVMHPAVGLAYLGYGWVTGNILFACLPSRQDWRIAAPSLVGVAAIGIGVLLYQKFG
jgi:hypothetical protein